MRALAFSSKSFSVFWLLATAACGQRQSMPQQADSHAVRNDCRQADETTRARLSDIFSVPADQRTYENTVQPLADLYAFQIAHCRAFEHYTNYHPDPQVRRQTDSSEFGLFNPFQDGSDELCRAVQELAARGRLTSAERLPVADVLGECRDLFDANPNPTVAGIAARLSELSARFTALERKSSLTLTNEDLESCSQTMKDWVRPTLNGSGVFQVSNPGMAWWLGRDCSVPLVRAKALAASHSAGHPETYGLLSEMLSLRQALAVAKGHSTFADYVAGRSLFKDIGALGSFISSARIAARAGFRSDRDEILRLRDTDPDHSRQPESLRSCNGEAHPLPDGERPICFWDYGY